MATVKGDVHDIGKNIVGVVLGCNGYEVIDLGVMVPADRILDVAAEQDCDVVGLSGLITPSLDEMVGVAKEMERRGLDLPLLVGGATTSKQHTAVRIAPEYGQPTVHVLDASRVVGVVADLLDGDRRARLDADNRADQDRLRALHAEKGRKPMLPLREARTRRTPIEWHADDLAVPPFTGVQLVEEDLATLREYVDWTFFFHAWELKGRYPAILDDPEKGAVARDLFAGANELLDEVVADGSLQARGVYGFWPARAEGDDLVLDGGIRFPMLRQQADHADSRPNRSLADFVAPAETGLADHVGAFAVAIHGREELADRFAAENDDYRAIMVPRAGRPARGGFRRTAARGGRRAWYAPAESLTSDERIGERFRGSGRRSAIPPAPTTRRRRRCSPSSTPSKPGSALTESFATIPGPSVSGLYFGHPQARYFSVGRVGERPGRGLRGAQRHRARRGRALAAPEPLVRAVGMRTVRPMRQALVAVLLVLAVSGAALAANGDPQRRITPGRPGASEGDAAPGFRPQRGVHVTPLLVERRRLLLCGDRRVGSHRHRQRHLSQLHVHRRVRGLEGGRLRVACGLQCLVEPRYERGRPGVSPRGHPQTAPGNGGASRLVQAPRLPHPRTAIGGVPRDRLTARSSHLRRRRRDPGVARASLRALRLGFVTAPAGRAAAPHRHRRDACRTGDARLLVARQAPSCEWRTCRTCPAWTRPEWP